MSKQNQQIPLATRMRPRVLSEYIGQQHLLAPGKPLQNVAETGKLHSMVFWGPPGSGKTSLAYLLAKNADAEFVKLSAVFSGVKEIRQVVSDAKHQAKSMVLFIDEVHRFNKAQQDAFLPYVEDGSIILIGATTENPSFELNNALLSRVRVYVLQALSNESLLSILQQALTDMERGYGNYPIDFPLELQKMLVDASDGDARRSLLYLETLLDMCDLRKPITITKQQLQFALDRALLRFDNQGEAFYDQISALHKAVRGSDPDAALYWLCRMLQGGCDPLYLCRRMLRMASEDIGNADPRAIQITLDACSAYERLGTPEGELAIAQALLYLACAPKSNAVYLAFSRASEAARHHGSKEVPLHLRNAPTKLMKELGYANKYRYAHDEPHGYAAGVNYFPESMPAEKYYHPVDRGLEIKIKEKLKFLETLDTR